MARYIIPVEKTPSQSLDISIENKNVKITLLTRGQYIYASFSINNEEKLNGLVCLNKNNLIPYSIGIKGKIYFEDTQGNRDPIYDELNDRWLLYYEEA